jgi:zinc transporter 1/2/3
MTIFVLFFVELMAMRYSVFAHTHDDEGSSHARGHGPRKHPEGEGIAARSQASSTSNLGHGHGHTPGDDHLGHTRKHSDHDADGNSDRPTDGYAAQMTAIFILEFGIIFHSIFIGLTLAVSGWADFSTLYVVLVFHQTFEGLGLGSRLAVTPWPKGKRWTPYVMAVGYGVSTPIAIAVGLGVRQAYVPGSQTALLVNGVCDSISAGILIYTGLVELMAHEFMFSEVMRKAPLRVVLAAFGLMCLGAGEPTTSAGVPAIHR